MATSSGGSEEDVRNLMDQRKKKRMLSNRESARRSRIRKQKHLDELATQLSQLRKQNSEMISSVNITTQNYLNVETQNRVLRAQVAELSYQLESLNELCHLSVQNNDMMAFVNPGCGFVDEQYGGDGTEFVNELMSDSLSYVYANQPILASADVLMY